MRILGIDPGLAIVGLGLLDAPERSVLQPVEWLTITTPAGLPLPERLCEIRTDLSAYLEETKPDLAVIEKLFFATNERTAIDVAHARGVIVQTVAERGIPLLEPTPLQMKQGVTGDGSADKAQVLSMLMLELRLATPPKPDDAADALALAMYGAFSAMRNAKHEIRTYAFTKHTPCDRIKLRIASS